MTNLNRVLSEYIEVDEDQKERIARLREEFNHMYKVIEELCVNSRETSLAVTKLEEASFWAIKGVGVERERKKRNEEKTI